eukprot:GILI01024466.1.p1 GENE.GILI01024466.1~~GILI01024466.1.p1  ORF type:complete len:200 (-),score=29.88 GILI01024466.1:203-748(-)
MNEQEIVEELLRARITQMSFLSQRLTSLRSIRSLWRQGNLTAALETMRHLRDSSVLFDFLSAVGKRTDLLSLDCCVLLLPQIAALLSHSHESYATAAIEMIQRLLTCFGSLIQDSRRMPVTHGIDLSREERLNKCNKCYDGFAYLLDVLEQRLQTAVSRADPVTRAAKELRNSLQGFLSSC